MARKTKRYSLKEIKDALARQGDIWFALKDFNVRWHNFKWDLNDVRERRRKRTSSRKIRASEDGK